MSKNTENKNTETVNETPKVEQKGMSLKKKILIGAGVTGVAVGGGYLIWKRYFKK